MSRYLFGPITPAFAKEALPGARASGDCLAFSWQEGADLQIKPGDTWESLHAGMPEGFQPDFIALYMPYTNIPHGLWSAPVPLVAIAPDWNLLWHHYRQAARHCELVLTDRGGAEAFSRAGFEHALAADLYGCEQIYVEQEWPDRERDIDILFVGNMNPAVQGERLPWLARLARLSDRYRVAIQTALSPEAYRQLLSRARIVFNWNSPKRSSKRLFEAAAAGALVFHPASDDKGALPLRDGEECVCYTSENLEHLLEHYLKHEDERTRLAESARRRAHELTFQSSWAQTLALIEERLPELVSRVRARPAMSDTEALRIRLHEFLNGSVSSDPRILRDLEAAHSAQPSSAWSNGLGIAHARTRQPSDSNKTVAERCAPFFEKAAENGSLLGGLNLAESLAIAGHQQRAIEQARRTLALLDRSGSLSQDDSEASRFPLAFDVFRVEWEKAGWQNADRRQAEAGAKRNLLRWRLHGLLMELTNDRSHAYEALLLRPDLSVSRAQLGAVLARTGHPLEAIPHLRRALQDNPFEATVARTLYHTLGAAGDQSLRRSLIDERRQLSLAAPQVVRAEAWFANPLPTGEELVSIIILCCNELEFTQRCLDSVLRETRSPYELILVDNGSTDGTPQFLAELQSREGPVRIEVIRNERNLGFPAGCNQGLQQARGRYVVFLNNDTIVTEHWLEGLVSRALHDWPHVGLVGAVTNYAPEPQGIPCSYALADLPHFAARRRREFAGRLLSVRRLSGFCLLARREVLERIGGFDERYGIGFFDDDDIGIRTREAGFRIVVALDVFIHHFGSQTFKGLGIDTRQQLQTNFEVFRQKWGDEHTRGYRLPEPRPTLAAAAPQVVWAATEPTADSDSSPAPALPRARRKRVTLTMIVKNEEHNLSDCLATAADLMDQVIVIDTGSSDATMEIAKRFGAEVHEFPWVDDFGAARNECLRYSTGDWNIWLDADDRLDPDNRRRVAAVLDQLGDEKDAYAVKVRSRMDPNASSVRLLDQVRIFPNHPQIRWEYRIHEQILPAVRRRGGSVRWTDVIVDHVGYVDASVRRSKLERNLRLLEIDNAQRPDDAFTLFNLGWTTLDLGKTDEAMRLLRRSLERSAPDSSIVRKLYVLLSQGNRTLGNRIEALALCREGQRHCPDDLELPFEEAQLARELGDFAAAEKALVRILEMPPAQHFASVDPALRGWRTRHLLASVYLQQNRLAEAEQMARQAARERPDFVPAWLTLGDVCLAQSRWNEVEEVAAVVADRCREPVDAAILQGRAALGRRQPSAARTFLERAIALAPRAVGPRVLLTHALLQEGADLAAAERALRDVLSLAPEHPEAKHNLTILLKEQGRGQDLGHH